MPLVGPRPVAEAELEKYAYDRDLTVSVKPGLTGEPAVSGCQPLGYPTRFELELRYVRDRTLATDLRIVSDG
jgi:exopolysaccharide production protein ExoY